MAKDINNKDNAEVVVDNSRFTYETKTGQTLTLTKKHVIDYIAKGVEITDSEYTMFFQLCKEYKVNPFIGEAYLIKYGQSPAQIILDYKVLQQIADLNNQYDGMESGVIVVTKDDVMVERRGQIVLPGETLTAGWCKVYRKDRTHHTEKACMLTEFQQFKGDKVTLNKNWGGKPAFMIEKVAKAQALREAFPNNFQNNVYSIEEATIIEGENNRVVEQETKEIGVSNKTFEEGKPINNPFDNKSPDNQQQLDLDNKDKNGVGY